MPVRARQGGLGCLRRLGCLLPAAPHPPRCTRSRPAAQSRCRWQTSRPWRACGRAGGSALASAHAASACKRVTPSPPPAGLQPTRPCKPSRTASSPLQQPGTHRSASISSSACCSGSTSASVWSPACMRPSCACRSTRRLPAGAAGQHQEGLAFSSCDCVVRCKRQGGGGPCSRGPPARRAVLPAPPAAAPAGGAATRQCSGD